MKNPRSKTLLLLPMLAALLCIMGQTCVRTTRGMSTHAIVSPPARVDRSFELPELKMQAYVGTQQFPPQHDDEWVEQCLNLNLDQKKFGCRIAAYRIQWFSGQWSGWFVPGVNDLYKKEFEPLRRYWACFNDHSFEIIYEADRKIDFSQK